MKHSIVLSLMLLLGAATYGQQPAKSLENHTVSAEKQKSLNTQKVEFQIEGMFCAACEKRVQALFTKQAGVKSAIVSYEGKKAVVDYDPAQITPGDMKTAFGNSAYKISLASPASAAPSKN